MEHITDSKSYKIQVLRGLSIVAVVFIHNTPPGLAQVWCRPFLNFSVGMFIFLSGMLSSAYRWKPRKRILKVAIPYVLWTLIYVYISDYGNIPKTPMTFVKLLLTARAAAIMYFIFVYCEFSLLIPIIDKLARSKFRWIGFVISPLEIICMRLIPIVVGYEFSRHVKIVLDISCLGWFTYFYLGYLLGNGLIEIKLSTSRVFLFWVGSIALQIAEGFWYYSMGVWNCGGHLKLSTVLTGILFAMLGFRYISTEIALAPSFLHCLGNYSFGIYFVHLAIMSFLNRLPYYKQSVVYPLNAIITLAISVLCVIIGRKVLGKYARYLAL